MQARDYQIQSKELIRHEFKIGNRKVLLWLATGAGKTFVFCGLVRDAVARGKRCLIVVRGRKLVDQASERLAREGVDHGVQMAGHWNFRPRLPVQVCSVDTVIARGLGPAELPADLIIIDEGHLATSPGYVDFILQYPRAFIITVTATPWVSKSLRHCADTIIHPITMEELVARGYLVPFRCFAPYSPDLSGVKIVNNEYQNEQLENVMSSSTLTGNVIEHWKRLAQDRPTIVFAVNIRHSKMLTDKFREAGITAEHCEANTRDSERRAVMERLEAGETKVVCNVGILCTGVDLPRVGCIVLARPTASRNLFVQQAGRGTRLAPGKSECLLLDHSGNIIRHGLPTDEDGDLDLDGKARRSSVTTTKICKECFAAFRGAVCAQCGATPPAAPERTISESEGQLVEVTKRPSKLFRNSPFKNRHK